MKENGKHETSPAGLRATKRDNKIAGIFAGLDSAPIRSAPIHDLSNKSIQDMIPAKTNAQRQAAFRARQAEQQTTEVRGIFAHPDDHAEVKEAAAKINRRRARTLKRAAP